MKDLTQGSPMRSLLFFTLPMLAGNVFQQLYNMVDLMVVGRFVGVDALAAVGACGSPTFFLLSLVMGMTTGAAVVTSQYFGAKDTPMVKKSIGNTVLVLLVTAVAVTALGYLIAEPLLRLLGTPEELLPAAASYLETLALGMTATVAYNGFANIQRAVGDSVTPLVFLIMAALLNIGLDLLFVIRFEMGVFGVAFATVLSQAVSAICCFLYVIKRMPVLWLSRDDLTPDRELMAQSVRLGLPTALQTSIVSVGGMFVQGIVNSFGRVTMAAYAASMKLDQLAMQPFQSLGMAVSTYTAQNVGAGFFDRVKQGLRSAFVLVVSFSAVLGGIVFVFGRQMVAFFVESGEHDVVDLGAQGLRTFAMFYVAIGMLLVMRSLLRGAGDAYIPTMSALVELPTRYIAASFLAPVMGPLGAWYAAPIAWCVGALFNFSRFLTGKWMSKAIVRTVDS